MANGIKIGSLTIDAFKVGSDNCKIYLGDTLLYPQSVSYKLVAQYSDTTEYTVECNGSSALTATEVSSHTTSLTSMTSAIVGNCVKRIDTNAFSGASSLTSITIDNGVEELGNQAFRDCSGLTSFSFPSSLTTIEGSCFRLSGLRNVSGIPSGVTFLSSGAFADMYSLSAATIPASVTGSSTNLFLRDSGLTQVHFEGRTAPALGADSFKNCTALVKIYIPDCDCLSSYEAQSQFSGLTNLIYGEDETKCVQVTKYYKVEDVSTGGTSGWTIAGSSTYNPDPTYYDDFDLETTSTSNSYKVAKVTIYGYDHFTYYLRSNANADSRGYVMASNIDELSTAPTSMVYSMNSAITNTYAFRKTPGSAVNLSNYRRITYNSIDPTVEHTFYVVFYGRTYISTKSNATILIPKVQTNENWEQVTFSASSNVASSQKSLYIDGSNSSSGGTSYWYYRWMVGLPAGSHSSYTNYSTYNYCPNVTSSTFTSVAGSVRRVNFTYDTQANKNLSFRLVDSNGNVLSPSDTVYYNMTYYNSCGASTSESDKALPFNKQLKVGGRFRFANSSNRHYIYGYSPNISLNHDYYVDNYQSTFDITYTKLSEEAVTITYTTYDPNDSETPAFKTDITWPYSGGTTSSTTLTSYAVPYTYPYEVSQTSNKFSASTKTFTASTTSRSITFTLYPNHREFASVAALEAYQYAWEGMNASVNGTNYQYKNGQWTEKAFNKYEYIRTANLATSYYKIDTGFYPTTANTLEVKFEMVDRSVDWGTILGWAACDGDSCDSTQFRFTTVTGNYAIIGRKGNTSGVSYKTIGANIPLTVKLPLNSSTYSWSSGGTFTSQNYNVGTFSLPSSTPLHLCSFGYNKKCAVMKVYYVKVYDANNNLVKHYVPSDYNGTPCFYEVVNGDYILDTYTGSSHGTLTLGPAV